MAAVDFQQSSVPFDEPAPLLPVREADWVEAALARRLMSSMASTWYVGVLFIPVVVGVLWTDATLAALLLWVACLLGHVACRMAVLSIYEHQYRLADEPSQRAFMRRYGLLWPVGGAIWGALALLFFDRSLLTDQFICWLILAGLGMFAIHGLSPHLRSMLGYIDALAATALGVMLWHMGVELHFQGPTYHWWLMMLVVVYWQLLRQAGQRLHLTHRSNFELQYRNNQLINSLTRETQAALDAVDTKNRFLASAAHDLRQPVHALGLYADWLRVEPDMSREIAPKIVESTRAVNSLFDSLFDLVRLDSGKVTLNVEAIDIHQLLHDLELRYRPLAEARGLQFRVRTRRGVVISDPILLQRLVGNLISNAIKYTESGGVLVASREVAGAWQLEVWDTGIGIAPAQQREIFREFYKVPLHAGTDDGFGLGLYIVKRLCTILGHPLYLNSRPGRGTVFRLVMQPTDVHGAAARAAMPGPGSPDPAGAARLL